MGPSCEYLVSVHNKDQQDNEQKSTVSILKSRLFKSEPDQNNQKLGHAYEDSIIAVFINNPRDLNNL